MAIRGELKRLKKEAEEVMPPKEKALPIVIAEGDKTFTVRWGFWNYSQSRRTREETYPIERLEEITSQTEFLYDQPLAIKLSFVGDDPEELYDVWERMGVERGTWSWEWRVQTYIRDKGMST